MAGSNERLIHKTATKSKMAIISIIPTPTGPMIAFKIANIEHREDQSVTIKAGADGKKEIYDFYLRDIDRAKTLADIIRVGRPIPYGIPYRKGATPGQKGGAAPSGTYGNVEYTADRVISLATNTKGFLRTARFSSRPDYGNAIQMEIVVRDVNSVASRPRVATYDYAEFEAMVAFGALSRALAKLE